MHHVDKSIKELSGHAHLQMTHGVNTKKKMIVLT